MTVDEWDVAMAESLAVQMEHVMAVEMVVKMASDKAGNSVIEKAA